LKKGCFKGLILLAILIGVAYYIAEKYGQDYWDSGKEKVLSLVHESLDKNFKKIVPNKYSEKLKEELFDYFSELKNQKSDEISDRLNEINQSLKSIIKDSIISELDFEKIREIINKNEITKKF